MKRVAVFSISTPTHFSLATCFFDSLAAATPSDQFVVAPVLFVVGSVAASLSVNVPDLTVIHAEHVLAPDVFEDLGRRYTPAEICWALKPYLLEYLLADHDICLYFDADIQFLGDLQVVVDEINDASVLLTPHYLSAFSHTEFGTNALTLLRSGVFNAGFIAAQASPDASEFLIWWKDRVTKFGRNDPDNGMCGDQRWLDLVPTLFPRSKICRHRGMNVGYWNLHERDITSGNGGFEVDGAPLVFFHFSGFIPESPLALSAHLRGYVAKDEVAILAQRYANTLKTHRTRWRHLPTDFAYAKWWHRLHRKYRFFLDLIVNPRACR
ncbi:hypothetical protein [Paraburkholderia bannensis]|uniref:hypothetical protein n=1 Tax=Paraburkholderia bannensis TaxID=765414 RepID=UPI002AB1C7BF|nr:hypothetical protein [Paraburkholderia bannensis]